MAAKNPIDMGEADVAYLQGRRKPLTTASSILISSSKYLTSGRMREVYAAMGLQRTGHDLPEAYLVPKFSAALNELTDWPQLFRIIEHERRAKPEFAAWLDARFVSDMKPADVADCAPGTLGARVYEFMTSSGFTLDFAFREVPGNDYEYFITRRVQSHDIEHMVTGFESTPLGQYELMIFTAVSNAIYFSETLAHEINRHGMLLLIVGGSGIRTSRAQRAFTSLVETAGCPVILTIGGRGVLAHTHPQLFELGCGPGIDIARDADVILVVGSSIGEKLGFGGRPFSRAQQGFPNYFSPDDGAAWIHLERDPLTIGRNRPIDLPLVGDMCFALPRLTEALARGGPLAGQERVEDLQSQRRKYYGRLYAGTTNSTPVHPGRMLMDVQSVLPHDVIMVRDGGAISVWQMHFLNHPMSEHLMALKQGMLGTGLPYANAAALVPGRTGAGCVS